MRSASTPSAEADVRCDKGRSGAPGERRRRGSTTANAEVEGPLIFSERSGDFGSSAWGGVLAGEDKAFIWEKARSSSSSSPSDCSSVTNINDLCSVATREIPRTTHLQRREHAGVLGPVLVGQAKAFFRKVSE